jgi:hypothetical protein
MQIIRCSAITLFILSFAGCVNHPTPRTDYYSTSDERAGTARDDNSQSPNTDTEERRGRVREE